ncbi:MAG TPA: sensor histidine kinase [Candidatus Paceibacterota bacterium]|nr:sensor histidine kinase [Candidatus Paceibacterota bacterium]
MSEAAQAKEATTPAVLTNAAQVRALPPAEAAKQLPVRLRGVAIDNNRKGQFALMDETAGIYAEAPRSLVAGFARGDVIEVDGVSSPGKFAPFLKAHAVRRIGPGRIPEPAVANRDDLLSGRLDAQWIEVSGVVRQMEVTRWSVDLEAELDNGGGRIFVSVAGRRPGVEVDSTVRLRGVCFYQFNEARQALRPILSIPAGEPILVKEFAVTDLKQLPVYAIGDLMRFGVKETYAHRVRLRGVVIYSQAEDGFWLHDSRHGIHVISGGKDPVKVGEEADVFGFVKPGDYGPLIEDAVFRKTGKTSSVPVILLENAVEALRHDSDLVQCEAVVQEQWFSAEGCRLKLVDGTMEFPAMLRSTNRNSLPRWFPGTRVRVTGVCLVGFLSKPIGTGTKTPQVFQILLRSPEDITVVQLPSWWNAEHVAWVTGGVSLTLLAAVGIVIWISRRRLQQEALERMKSEAEFAAVMNERNRMARELHDTLAQGLGAISLHLETAKRQLPANAAAQSSVEEARLQTRASMGEVRNAIWNMRSQVLETGDLASALQSVLHSLADISDLKSELRVKGNARRFAPVVENNLLRIGQEAITNAVKHAQAKHVEVVLQFDELQFELSVSDDGRGFDPAHPPTSEGGLGLTSMRERAAELNGTLTVNSVPGKGTVIRFLLPLSRP